METVKVVLLGDSEVGKTSLANRFVTGEFSQEAAPTIGALLSSRIISIGSRTIKFNIWDTAGQERFRSVAKALYQGAEVIILVYDITSRRSFESLKIWLQDLNEHCKTSTVLAVAGNKEDLVDSEAVDIGEARRWAGSIGAVFKKTSAKAATGVEALFNELAEKIKSIQYIYGKQGDRAAQSNTVLTSLRADADFISRDPQLHRLGLSLLISDLTLVLAVLRWYATRFGDPGRLVHGWDFSAELCGTGDLADKPFDCFPVPKETLDTAVGLETETGLISEEQKDEENEAENEAKKRRKGRRQRAKKVEVRRCVAGVKSVVTVSNCASLELSLFLYSMQSGVHSTTPVISSSRRSEKYSLDSTASEILKQYSHNRAYSSGEDHMRTPKTDSQANLSLYRYEADGVVVYDSMARMATDVSSTCFVPVPRDPSSYDRKDLELASEFGTFHLDRQQLFSLPRYPPFKPRVYEYTLVAPENSLKFDSHFESGNLWKAIKVSDTDYKLYLEFDVHTKGHTQWYYFSVSTGKAQGTISFSIENLIKYDSLYLNGMQPLVYSRMKEGLEGVKWHRAGFNISYYQNQAQRDGKGFYYTLSFQYTFLYRDDTVYFAHCFPYTHSELMRDLDRYKEETARNDVLRVDTLCKTLAGNECPVLTITSDVSQYPSWESEFTKMMKSAAGRRLLRQKESRQELPAHRKKRAVILSARVHPGESNSSYMLKGAVEFLLSNTKEAKILRREYVFKVIPMLNPDGVVYGNYRCSLLGVDLNRRWLAPNRILHPTVYYAKRLMQMVAEEHELVMYCDMHGHSMKKNVFVYGCADKSDRKRDALLKLIPLLLHQRNKIFSFNDSHFRIDKSKEATARIVAFREINVLNSYTLEASFCGPQHSAALENRSPDDGESSKSGQMNEGHLAGLGKDLCRTLLVFLNPVVFRRKLNELTALLTQQITPPSFLTRARQPSPPPVSTEEKIAQSDIKTVEELEKPTDPFTIDNAIDEIGQQEALLEELSMVKEDETGVDSGSDAAPSDNDDKGNSDTLPPLTPRSVASGSELPSSSPQRVVQKPSQKSLPPKRSRQKGVMNKSVDSCDRLESRTTDSASEEKRSLGLKQQVERMYKMLHYYREARPKPAQGSNRGRPVSPVKLNQSVFPGAEYFDQWRKRKQDSETHRKRLTEMSPKLPSPIRPKRREKKVVNMKAGKDDSEEGLGVFDFARFAIPASARGPKLPIISKSFNFYK